VKRFFNKLKHFLCIATRYEQTARAFLSMVTSARSSIRHSTPEGVKLVTWTSSSI